MRRLTAVQTTVLAAGTLIAAACTGVIGAPGGTAGSGGGGGIGATGGGSSSTTGGGSSSTTGGGSSSTTGGGGSTGGGSSSPTGEGGVAAGDAGAYATSFPTLAALGFGPEGTTNSNPNAAGAMVLRHLEQFEYINTVTSLFGAAAITTAAVNASSVPAEPPVPNTSSGFPLPGLVDVTTATAYQANAEAIAKAILPNISSYYTCTPGTVGSATATACANTFITTFGQQMFRRPLTTAEVTGLAALYQTGVTTLGLTFGGAIDLLIEEMLQSPGFLYHWELGPTPTVAVSGTVTSGTALTAPVEVQLDGYALANRLSYFLWGTMPDTNLFTAAAGNQLSTVDQVSAQATRMLQDPKAQPAVVNFFNQWLGMTQLAAQSKDPTTYPTWGATLAADMQTEFQTFVTDVVFNRTGELSELYTSSQSYINADLATLYGATGVTGTTFQATTLDSTQRAGLLTTGAWLALNGDPASSNPVYRGHSLYTQMLCGLIPPPPPNVPAPSPPSAGGTTRSRFQQHDTQACAVSCHSVMDPYGYAFESYGGIGEWRTVDNGDPVISTSTVVIDGKSVPVAGATAMVPIIAQSATAQECFTAQYLTYALGRPVTTDDAPSAQAAYQTFTTSNDKVTNLLSALASSPTFRYRTASVGEVLP